MHTPGILQGVAVFSVVGSFEIVALAAIGLSLLPSIQILENLTLKNAKKLK